MVLALAAAPPEEPPTVPAPIPADQVATPTALRKARHQAAQKVFDEAWSYYRQARSEAFPVYAWSKLLLHAQMAMANHPAEQLAALEAHHQRMKDLETLVIKVRRLGFGKQIEVGESEYFRLEAACWLAHARAVFCPGADSADQAATLTALRKDCYRVAQKQFDEAWSYYKQARCEAFPVYLWSKLLLRAQVTMANEATEPIAALGHDATHTPFRERDMAHGAAEPIAALEAHHQRMKDLETLVIKVRWLGFGRQIEVGATEYFRLEAEHWLARARATADAPAPRPVLVARAAQKQFNQAWSYYRQARADAYFVGVWSYALLNAQMVLTDDQNGQIAALEAHRQRVKDLETLVTRVRQLGCGTQIEVWESHYFRIDAECLLARARDNARNLQFLVENTRPH
jgi:hypothetical protein